MNITIKRTINLSEPILPEVLSAPLYEGEKNAHTFMITAEKDKLPHALSGSVVAYFERNDGNTVRVEGETKDGAAILTLSPECYQTGVFYLAVMLISDGAQTVIYAASGRVRNTQDGEIINGGDAMPTYEEILEHLNKYLSANVSAKVVETAYGAEIITSDAENGETRAKVYNGKSAYEIAKENGYKGTEEEWLNETVNNVLIVQCKISEDDSLIYADKTQEEVRKAVSDGKAVIMVDAEFGFTSLYMGEGTVDGELCPVFVSPLSDEGQTALFSNYRYLKKTGEVIWRSGAPINQLTINYGDERYTFDGSQPTGIDIKDDVFIVRVNASGKADKTQAETIAALQNGKAALMIINGGEIYTYAIMSAHPSFPSVLSPLFVSPITGDFGGDKYRTIAYLLPNNTVVKNTELLNTSGGGTGGTIEIPTADEILQTLIDTNFLLAVTDADGAILTDSDGAILMM